MRHQPNKSTPKVSGGRVRPKNDRRFSPDYFYGAVAPHWIEIDRKRPANGFCHVLNRRDIHRFLALLPEWDSLAVGLNAIVLASGDDGLDGSYYHCGVVTISAWETGLWRTVDARYYSDHAALFVRLGVTCATLPNGDVECRFDEGAVRAFQLLHILLHELGHHHDRMTTRRQKRTGRGETFAEDYAHRHEAMLWRRYWAEFGG